jgi:hypothetical protein
MTDTKKVLAAARRALKAGGDPAQVDDEVRHLTGRTVDQLAAEVGGPGLRERMAENRENAMPARDQLRMAAQGATFGFGDEIAGVVGAATGRGYAATRDASRERLAQIRNAKPVAAAVAEGLGGVAVPVGAVVNVARGGRAALPAMKAAVEASRSGQLGRAAAHGALTGGVVGGLFGIGEAEGGLKEHAAGAALGGATGAGLGAVTGAVGGAVGRRAAQRRVDAAKERAANAPRSDQLAEEFAAAAGVPGGRLAPAREAVKRELRRISDEAYKPLEEAHPVINDAQIRNLLRGEIYVPVARRVMGKRAQANAPSFSETQAIRRALTSRGSKADRAGDSFTAGQYREAAEQLTQAMERRIPGYSAANRRWMGAKQAGDAIDQGYKLGTKRLEVIEEALGALPADGMARAHLRTGLAARFYDQLTTKGGPVTLAQVRNLQSVGMSRKLRLMFADEGSYQTFMRRLQDQERAFIDAAEIVPEEIWLRRIGWAGAGLAAGSLGAGDALGLFK